MTYSNLYFKPRSRPSVALIVGACVGVAVLLFMIWRLKPSAPIQATKKTLKRIEIININPHQAGILWQTDAPATGWVVWGDSAGNLQQVSLDERDLESQKNKYEYHYVLIKNLTEGQDYFYKVVSNDELISAPDSKAFSFHTPKTVAVDPSIKPAYGKIVMPNGDPAANAMVLYYYGNGIGLLSLSKESGEWLIPLQSIYDKLSYEPIPLSPDGAVKIDVLGANGSRSKVMTVVNQTNPLAQTIVLDKDYTLTGGNMAMANPTAGPTPAPSDKLQSVDILYPKENGIIAAGKPLLRGVGLPNTDVFGLIVAKTQQSLRGHVDANGDWKMAVASALLPGSYTFTLTGQDEKGKTITRKRSFIIAKSGEQVLGDATGSANASPTSAPTAAVTPLPTTPVITSAATPAPTYAPVSSITPTPTKLLSTGASPTVFLMASFALIAMGIGILFVF